MTKEPKIKCILRRVRLNNGGYDDTGTYWGVGLPLYRLEREDGEKLAPLRGLPHVYTWHFRAVSRDDAKRQARDRFGSSLTFHN